MGPRAPQVIKDDTAVKVLPPRRELPPPEFTSLVMNVLIFLAFGCSDLHDHWNSLQSDRAFEALRRKLCSILGSTITTASVLLAISVAFVSTASPVPYLDYSTPAPYCLLFMSLMLAIIAILTSGSSMMRWLHTDRRWIQKQLKQSRFLVVFHLLSIIVPIFFVVCSLNCLVSAMMTAGLSSHSTASRAVTVFCLIIYVLNIGTILMEAVWKYHARRQPISPTLPC
ncbi:hypothetical protein BDR06DRAFT_951606 [Suillus hirtellus]|nr:hypothetical protein BDR06DRAFT_951606 [Suillus hirtellus]